MIIDNLKFVLASRNLHKLKELRELLGIPSENLICAADFPGAPDPEENGATFEENALIKARALRDFTGMWAVSDDSGLTVEALGGAPGIYSARYAQGRTGLLACPKKEKTMTGQKTCPTNSSDSDNNRCLLSNLASHPRPWRAAYECVIAIVSPDGKEFTASGSCSGEIIPDAHGTNGFGYDPYFIPDGFKQTFAELPPEIKQTFSHRAHAAEKARVILNDIFNK